MSTALEEYSYLIEGRHVIAGYWVKAEVRNLIRDLQDPTYIYDTREASRRFKFEETLCFQSKAPYYKMPLELMPWQKAFWEVLYSFQMADTMQRRFTDALLEVARKNGKSVMLGADGACDLFTGEGGQDICCSSNDDRQAKLIWREVAMMREHLDPKRVLTRQSLTELSNRRKNINIYRLSSKTQNKDGFLFSKVYLDEAHDIREENGQSEIAEALWRSMSTVDEPIFITCTTQGFNRDCYLDRRISTAKKVISGEIENPHLLPFLFEQDSEAEIWTDPASWEKSNPSLRYGIKKRAKLAADVDAARYDKATRIHLLTKDFNIPQANAQTWLMLEDYDYAQNSWSAEDFRGSYTIGAVDLSATTDLSNAKALFIKSGERTKYVLSHYWIPESKLAESDDKEAGAKYAEWAKEGLVTICEGNEVDIGAVADWFLMLYKKYKIKPLVIGYDQRYAEVFKSRCSDYGFEVEMLAQGRYLSSAMKLTEADLKSRVINYNANPIDKWNLSNTCCQVDGVGDIQPRKIPGQPKRRIDGGVTLIMLEETYRRHGDELRELVGGA